MLKKHLKHPILTEHVYTLRGGQVANRPSQAGVNKAQNNLLHVAGNTQEMDTHTKEEMREKVKEE